MESADHQTNAHASLVGRDATAALALLCLDAFRENAFQEDWSASAIRGIREDFVTDRYALILVVMALAPGRTRASAIRDGKE